MEHYLNFVKELFLRGAISEKVYKEILKKSKEN